MASTVPVTCPVAFDSGLTVLPSSSHHKNSPRTAFEDSQVWHSSPRYSVGVGLGPG
jgi:hypothetical protein